MILGKEKITGVARSPTLTFREREREREREEKLNETVPILFMLQNDYTLTKKDYALTESVKKRGEKESTIFSSFSLNVAQKILLSSLKS